MPANHPVPHTGYAVERSDPYPERSDRDHGVRQHTPPATAPAWEVTERHDPKGPLLFAAALPSITDHPKPRRFPLAAVGLYTLGQVVLAAAIAIGQVSPIVGIAVCLLWMVCGMLLIAAQVTSDRPKLPVLVEGPENAHPTIGSRAHVVPFDSVTGAQGHEQDGGRR